MSSRVAPVMVRVEVVAPAILPPSVNAAPSFRHWYAGAGEAVAVAVRAKVALCPAPIVCDTGCCVIAIPGLVYSQLSLKFAPEKPPNMKQVFRDESNTISGNSRSEGDSAGNR